MVEWTADGRAGKMSHGRPNKLPDADGPDRPLTDWRKRRNTDLTQGNMLETGNT